MGSHSQHPTNDIETDVLIVGGGPVGLILAYQLRLFSHYISQSRSRCLNVPDPDPISVHIVEAQPKNMQENFGRAVTFWPRSVEMLCQLAGLGEEIMQHCCAVRKSAAYDVDGNEVFGRGWSFVEGIEDTRFKFASVLRQKFVEKIVRGKLAEFGVGVHAPHRFVGVEVDESVEDGGHKITATIVDTSGPEEREYKVRCRYLLGCDGSRTKVRGAAGIESEGTRTEDKWIRIDGVLKHTTMPKPRCYGAIESPIYGNVLWIPLDHGATRIGFALKEERSKLYPELTQEAYIQEAKLSVAPFEIEYERVDWASVYMVGQRLAKNFWTKGCIFLCGDSARTHSSAAGQGMNAASHDAVNLGWKLALVLKGIAKKEILATYEEERRPPSERLIRYDEDLSVLVTGRVPKTWTGDPNADPNVVLGQILQEVKGFNLGLNISYAPNLAVFSAGKENNGEVTDCSALDIQPAIPGYRAPDVQLLSPALWQPVWFQQLTPNLARFYIVVFVGKSDKSKESFGQLKRQLHSNPCLSHTPDLDDSEEQFEPRINGDSRKPSDSWPVSFLTVLPQIVANQWHELGTDALGKVYFDGDGHAGQRYGIDMDLGTVFVIRPDGWIGAKLGLAESIVAQAIDTYLGGMLHS